MDNYQFTISDYIDDADPIKQNLILHPSTDWKWSFNDYPANKNGLKVFSLFAGGGGSTMGYKLAGCDVVGCCEIDKRMNSVYVTNHNPKYNYLMDVRDFNALDNLPDELYNLDILDGSPPCSTFSMAGYREKSWGKKKLFREGQIKQTLDELPFVMIETANKLRPKVVIMENVEGLLKGNAFDYVQKIYSLFHKIGYTVRHNLLKGENMGIPQKRHRVFFIATRLDFDLMNIDLYFNYEKVLFKEIADGKGRKPLPNTEIERLLNLAPHLGNVRSIGDCYIALGEKHRNFCYTFARHNDVCPTVVAKSGVFNFESKCFLSKQELISASTFPIDYNFMTETDSAINYICGMSVPPIMTKRVVKRLIESKIFNVKEIKQ